MKTIIEMAREADVYCTTRQPTLDAMLERFAALVRADEREACAKVCDRAVGDGHPDDMHSDGQWAALTLAAEIRARGNT